MSFDRASASIATVCSRPGRRIRSPRQNTVTPSTRAMLQRHISVRQRHPALVLGVQSRALAGAEAGEGLQAHVQQQFRRKSAGPGRLGVRIGEHPAGHGAHRQGRRGVVRGDRDQRCPSRLMSTRRTLNRPPPSMAAARRSIRISPPMPASHASASWPLMNSGSPRAGPGPVAHARLGHAPARRRERGVDRIASGGVGGECIEGVDRHAAPGIGGRPLRPRTADGVRGGGKRIRAPARPGAG